MKKLTVFFILMVCILCVPAEEQKVLYIAGLINDGLEKKYDAINDAAKKLTEPEKLNLYSIYKKTAALPFAASLLVGFGTGSFIQGDSKTGVEQLVIEAICTFDLSMALPGVLEGSSHYDYGIHVAGLIIGAVGLVYSKIRGCVVTFRYTDKYNDMLMQALY